VGRMNDGSVRCIPCFPLTFLILFNVPAGSPERIQEKSK